MTSSTECGLAWDRPNLAGPDTIRLHSPDFDDNGRIPSIHAAVRAGGENLSPALVWIATAASAQLLLIIEDPDAPTRTPYLHCLALLDGSLRGLERGALSAPVDANGVQFALSPAEAGYLGPAPPKSHGPHRYVFQLFAVAAPLDLDAKAGSQSLAALTERLVSNADVRARGRLNGTYRRT